MAKKVTSPKTVVTVKYPSSKRFDEPVFCATEAEAKKVAASRTAATGYTWICVSPEKFNK